MEWARSIIVWRKGRGLLGALRKRQVEMSNKWPKEFFGQAQRSMELKSLKGILRKLERFEGIISTFSLTLTSQLDYLDASR